MRFPSVKERGESESEQMADGGTHGYQQRSTAATHLTCAQEGGGENRPLTMTYFSFFFSLMSISMGFLRSFDPSDSA